MAARAQNLAPPASGIARWRWIVGGMLWHRRHPPHGPEVLELGLDALHVQPYRGAVGEVQRDVARGRLARLVAESEQADYGVLVAQIDALHLGAQHPLKAQGRAPATILLLATLAASHGVGPVEAVGDGGKPSLARQKGDVADPKHGILHVRG